jgi:inner membrane protein
MGEALAGERIGKKAMIVGLVAHSIPDIDFVAALWLSTADNLHAHRGFTHSILFVLLISLLMAAAAKIIFKRKLFSYSRWFAIVFLIAGLHIFLDAFNNYGVGWFEPFSNQRISFNAIYVADPFFSIVPGIAAVMLLLLKNYSAYTKFWWRLGLGWCVLYIGYCLVNKITIDRKVKQSIASQTIPAKRFMTTPAPLQNWLWFVAAETDSGFYTGYVSVFDRKENTIFSFSPKNKNLLNQVVNREEADKLIQFSQGYYTIEKHADTILLNDLRFGQITGWYNPAERFAFYYYLQPEMDNTLVVQRGRFANWNRTTFQSFLKRIKGN